MHTFLCTLLFYALSCNSIQVPLGLRFDMKAALPTLTLPYATYRAASYNPIGNVSNGAGKGVRSSTNRPLDLHFQKHPLCSSPNR